MSTEIIGYGDSYVGDQEFVGDDDIDRLMAMGASPHPAPSRVRTVKAQMGVWKRHYLPLNLTAGTTVAAGGAGVLANNPQRLFKPSRLVIPSDVAGLFAVTGIFIGVKAQLVATGSIPARLFSETSFDTDFEGDTAQVSQTISVNVTNNSLGASPITAGMRGLTVF